MVDIVGAYGRPGRETARTSLRETAGAAGRGRLEDRPRWRGLTSALGGRSAFAVQAAFGAVLAGPAPLAPAAGQGAGRAADRAVAAIVQGVVRKLVLGDVGPDL